MNRLEKKAQSIGMKIAIATLDPKDDDPIGIEKTRALGEEIKQELIGFADAILELQSVAIEAEINKRLKTEAISRN